MPHDKVILARQIIADVCKRLAAEEEVLGSVYQKLLVPTTSPPRGGNFSFGRESDFLVFRSQTYAILILHQCTDLYKEWLDGHYRLKVQLQRLETLNGEEPSFDHEIRALAEVRRFWL